VTTVAIGRDFVLWRVAGNERFLGRQLFEAVDPALARRRERECPA